MQIAQVGSSIHGSLLSPSDIDIAISYESNRFNKFLSFLKLLSYKERPTIVNYLNVMIQNKQI